MEVVLFKEFSKGFGYNPIILDKCLTFLGTGHSCIALILCDPSIPPVLVQNYIWIFFHKTNASIEYLIQLWGVRNVCLDQDWKLGRYQKTNTYFLCWFLNTSFIRLKNVAGALVRPNGIILNSYIPWWVLKVVLCMPCSVILIWW